VIERLCGAAHADLGGSERAMSWGKAGVKCDCSLVVTDCNLNISALGSLDFSLDEVRHCIIWKRRDDTRNGFFSASYLIRRRVGPTIVDLHRERVC
jgi:hypothetical protein